ncbi:zinc-binding alcohol dehydrogenase family protein [Sphingomonas sanxanigenens]|uniref:Dehydrogenase n=1 Tax=Sphingomonas sanxanigenens DSM 19645 = NX02 TaxID=1123269 RepID=W0A9H2_9SPHN|nr:zinc-binding alcohol dehydrogenase family protein [Sphingomonas sanxanigenens]AHE53746.1 hypothetical protein NX02_10145 [Sphingomonas sanxanigenens DSM 19645 = NX02]
MDMSVVTCVEPGRLSLENRPMPERAPGQALLRIRRVGVCGTDYHIVAGKQPYLSYPRVIGHELAAEVIEVDPGSALVPGMTVSVLPYLACGTCIACRRGKPNCCVRIEVLGVHRDGGLAEYLVVEERYVIPAEGLSLDQAAMVEFLAIGMHAVRRAQVGAQDRVLVVGAGPIGLAVTLFAKQTGAAVTVLDGNRRRATFAVDKLGAVRAEVPGDDLRERLSAATDGDFFDVVFDATGNPGAMEAGFLHAAHGGRYVLVSIVSAEITFSDPEFHKRELTLMGSRNATAEDFAAVIDAIRSGVVPTRDLHSHDVTLAELPERMGEWMRPETGVIKGIVRI